MSHWRDKQLSEAPLICRTLLEIIIARRHSFINAMRDIDMMKFIRLTGSTDRTLYDIAIPSVGPSVRLSVTLLCCIIQLNVGQIVEILSPLIDALFYSFLNTATLYVSSVIRILDHST